MNDPDDPLFDDDAGPLVRPFAVTRGRTTASQFLDMVTLVMTASSVAGGPGPEHRRILDICRQPRSVAEVAATMNLPTGAAKVLISDLIELGSMVFRVPEPIENGSLDRELIRTVIDGIRRL